MIRRICRWILLLSPSRFRRDFGDEVMDVLELRLREEGASARFVARELVGLLKLVEWPVPVVGGILGAALLHGFLYTVVGMLLRKGYALFAHLDSFGEQPMNYPVVIGFYALFGVLTLVPLFLVLAFRIRHARTTRSYQAL